MHVIGQLAMTIAWLGFVPCVQMSTPSHIRLANSCGFGATQKASQNVSEPKAIFEARKKRLVLSRQETTIMGSCICLACCFGRVHPTTTTTRKHSRTPKLITDTGQTATRPRPVHVVFRLQVEDLPQAETSCIPSKAQKMQTLREVKSLADLVANLEADVWQTVVIGTVRLGL